MKIRAAVLYELNKPLRIEEVDLPELLPGQVLVKIAFSGVCHSQLMEARGRRGEDPYLPHMLGHEGSGTVVRTGEGVTKVVPGDKVVLGWIKGAGMDVPGSQYHKEGITINAGGVTTFSDYSVVSENRCVRLPQGVPMDCAVLFGCAIPTGAGMVMNQAKPERGSTIAVFGIGGVGISALMTTRLFECATVIVIDVVDEKLKLALDFGATHTVDARKQNVLEEINNITKGKGVDYSIETSGLAASIETAFKAVRKFGGLCVFASHPQSGDKIQLDPYDLICGKRIEGSWGGVSNPEKDIPKFAKLYREGELPLERLITQRYSLDEVNEALNDLEGKRIVRALIEMKH